MKLNKMRRKGFLVVIFHLVFIVSTISAYQVKSDVLSSGGTEMTSSGYIAKGTLSQLTASSACLSSSGYRAIVGFWHPPYGGVGIKEKSSLPLDKILVNFLAQNKPNPVSNHTAILYCIVQKGIVSLEIYNVAGQKISTLVNEKQEPGIYKIRWNTRSVSQDYVPNGVYFYRLQTGALQKSERWSF